MRRWFVGMTALGLACGGDSSGPGATSVTGVAGDNQTASRGSALPVPLSFTALGSDGLPIEGVSVTWSATPTAAASFSPPTTTTDANGIASTNVVLGAALGQITMQATLNGVPPVVYHATSLDPCLADVPYTLGDTVSAALSRADCKLNGFFYDFYSLDLPPGQNSIRISLDGTNFDAYLELFTTAGPKIGEDDDIVSGVNQDSRLDIILGEGGAFVIGATSFDPDTVGPYKLFVTTRATTLSGCQDAWITPGATFVDTVRTNDCSLNGNLFDFLWIWATGGTVLQFAERSTQMNPLLKLYRANFATQTLDSVAANDDSSAGNQNAYISHTVPSVGLYQLRLGTTVAGDTGEYTLVFSPVSPSPRPTRALVPDFVRSWARSRQSRLREKPKP